MSGAFQEGDGRWTIGTRVIANQIDRAQWRTTLQYQVLPSLRLGVEYNPLANDVGPLANWIPVSETEHRPALILGTSSDRIGTPHGRAFYGTVSKNLEPYIGWSVSPYAGVVFGTYEDEWRPITGGTVEVGWGFSTQVMYDGVNTHGLLNYQWRRHTFSFLMVDFEDPGFSYSIAF